MKLKIQKFFTCVFLGVVLKTAFALRCNREPEGVHAPKSLADNRFEIKIRGHPDKYVAGGDYTVSLRGVRSGRHRPTFKRFMLVVQPSYSHNLYNIIGHRNVGSLSLTDNTLSKFSNDCPNAIIQTSTLTKSEIQVTWTAPASGSGCVVFRATVVEDHDVWYMDDGSLSLVLCEDVRESDIDQLDEEVEKCCACEDAMFEMVFEGIWSKHTHPKDFPSNKWETAFGDVIGASHSAEYNFWEYGDFASKGLRRLAELGDTHELENEIMSHARNVRTIIKARGLRYPNITGRTYSVFRVDTQNHLMSIVSKIDPSPDWIVGVSGVNLCLKNCSWVQSKIINLYPWDVGSDSGISYNSPNSPSNPQQPISRITPSYPNDPASPFYDATGEEMKPLAQLHLMRQQLYEKPCSIDDGDSEPEPEEELVECMVTNWSKWSPCSESCGKGERFRQRSYLNRKKAHAMGCTEQLKQHGVCYGSDPSCRKESDCEPMEWGPWGECSVTCGNGVKTRTRHYRTRQEHKHCVSLPDSPELTDTRDCTGIEGDTCEESSQENEDCPHTEWSTWSPCSASCGKGKSIRVLLSTEDDVAEQSTQSDDCPEVGTIEEQDCFDLPSCDMNEELYRELCLSPLKEGGCNRNNSRWYFDVDTKTCQNFIYKGCFGNKNNFLIQEDCENTCIKGSEDLLEEDEEDTKHGPIGGLWPASQIIDTKATYGIQNGNIPKHIFESIQNEPYLVVDGPVVDCVVGRWTKWSSCSVSCGAGYKTRHRKILIHPRNGGLACPKIFKKKKCRKPCAPGDKKIIL